MKVRIKDIAEKARVSVGTVDRVIHDRGEVSVNTRQKIMAIIAELNYEPDILARTLASKKEYRIAISLPEADRDNEFWQVPIEGMEQAVNEINYFGFGLDKYMYDQFDVSSFNRVSSQIIADKPDALVFAPVFRRESEQLLKECSALGIPVILINSVLEDCEHLCYIGQDSFVSGQLAGRLISCGLQASDSLMVINIAADKDNYQHIAKREQGFIKFFRDHEYLRNIKVIRRDVSESTEQKINACLAECLDENANLRGVFVTNSKVYQVGQFFADNGLRNIRLIGYDLIASNVKLLQANYIDYLISQKPREQGYKAIMSLFNHKILQKDIEKVQYIPIDIITRENLEYYQ